MLGLVLCKGLELGTAAGRGTLDSYRCVVPLKLAGTLLLSFTYHTIAALLVSFFSRIFQVLLSVHDYLYLTPIERVEQYRAELRWYRSCLIFSRL